MGDEGAKLFSTRPKKSKLKVPTASSSGATAPPQPHPKASSRSRHRVLVPLILGLNFTIGAYVFVKTTLRNRRLAEDQVPEGLSSSTLNSTSIHAAHTAPSNTR